MLSVLFLILVPHAGIVIVSQDSILVVLSNKEGCIDRQEANVANYFVMQGEGGQSF